MFLMKSLGFRADPILRIRPWVSSNGLALQWRLPAVFGAGRAGYRGPHALLTEVAAPLIEDQEGRV